MLIEDSNNKPGKHEQKRKWWLSQGEDVRRYRLPYGDYALPPKISVDTKASLHEIATNLCGSIKEQARVREECKLARDCGAVLVFLIEVGKYKTSADLIGQDVHLKNGKTIPGVQLHRAMEIMAARYGCRFEFCPPSKSAERILEILRSEQ